LPDSAFQTELIFDQHENPCDVKPTTQLAELPAQLLARQQARNPAGKHAPCAASFIDTINYIQSLDERASCFVRLDTTMLYNMIYFIYNIHHI